MLRSVVNYLGQLHSGKDQEFISKHTVSVTLTTCCHCLYFPYRCGRSPSRSFHQSVWCFLFEHFGTRFSRYHGNLRFMARQARSFQMGYVEGYWAGYFRFYWTFFRNLCVARWNHQNILNPGILNSLKSETLTEATFYINYIRIKSI